MIICHLTDVDHHHARAQNLVRCANVAEANGRAHSEYEVAAEEVLFRYVVGRIHPSQKVCQVLVGV